MSGVNGGIDYTIDLTTLPTPLSKQIQTIQQGPESPTALIEAAEDIATASATYPETLPVLVDMLGFNNPVAARVAIDALVQSGESSVPHLLTGVAAFNYSVNAYALRALARIGDPSVAVVALECAKKGPIPNVRRAACQTLAGLRYKDAGEASTAWECLVGLVERESDWGVRYAAIVAMERFQEVGRLGDQEVERGLSVVEEVSKDSESDATVRARAYVAYEEMAHLRKRAFTTASKTP